MRLSVAWFLLLVASVAPGRGEVQRRALLVSLARYPDGQTIEGAHEMSDALAARLVGQYGFAASDIHRLRDEQATKAGLFQAIDDCLVDGLHAGDVAVLWFAGHGSRIPDDNDDEPDGYDEVLCLWDMYEDPLIDDELPPVLARVPALGFTVLLDCCHSGTATRGGLMGDAVVRNLFQELPNVRPSAPSAEAALQPMTGPGHYSVLSASRADEPAVAVSSRTKGDFLVFTKALTDSLTTASQPASYRTVMQAMQQQIAAWQYIPVGRDEVQQPQFEGPDLDRPIFAPVTAPASSAWLAALTIACDNQTLREACEPPLGATWAAGDDTDLRVLATAGDAWDCVLSSRSGELLDRTSAPTVALAGTWLQLALWREQLVRAAARLDADRTLPLQVSVVGEQMQVEARAPEGWHLIVYEILPDASLLVLYPSTLFPPRDEGASLVVYAPPGRGLVGAVATPRELDLSGLRGVTMPWETVRRLQPPEALAFLQSLDQPETPRATNRQLLTYRR